MAYSFPVFRKGMIFRAGGIVSVTEADKLRKLIKKEKPSYVIAFKNALISRDNVLFEKETPKKSEREPKQNYIIDFDSIDFTLTDDVLSVSFKVRASYSMTVCMYDHWAKIWIRFTCKEMNKKPAVDMTAREINRYFRLSERKSALILPALVKKYREHVAQLGGEVPHHDEYFFRFRAFNSLSLSSAELCKQLREGLTLREALKIEKYQAELLDFFRVVIGRKLNPDEVIKTIENQNIHVFDYRSSDNDALFVTRTNEKETDLCGYGYDISREPNRDFLSQATTRDLLIEYAQKF